jgi:CO/xanthine dehydrogenase Mo-binding subunit
MNILPGNLRFGAGQPVKRLEDQRLLTGKGQFIDDKPEEGALRSTPALISSRTISAPFRP